MRNKAFTLIELAMVLVIIGILLSIGIGLFTVLIKQSKFKASKDIVQTACEAIKGYAEQHKKLPSDLSSLGVKTIDPYNNPLKYKQANGSASGDFNFCQQNPTDWLIVYDRNTTKNNVAFIVYSISENRKDDTDCSQGTNPCSQSADFQIREYGETTNAGTKYDDIVCYLDIYSLRELTCPPLEITTNSLPEAIQYLQYDSGVINISGGEMAECQISLDVKGLNSVDTTNPDECKITGTPEVSGTYPVTVTITDKIGRKTSKTLNLVIQPNPVKIETPALPYAYTGQDYSVGLSASGATGSYTWTLVNNGGLTGLSINPTTGVLSISGTNLTTAGVYNITVQVCDATYTSECAEKTYPLTVLSYTGGGGSGGGGGGGSGGGGGGGGGGCSNYEVHIIKSSYSGGDYVNSAYMGSCKSIGSNRRHYTFNNVTSSTVDLFTSSGCSGTPGESYTLSSIDSDGDCIVYIACNGDVDSCKIYDTPMVYCPTAKFYDTGSAKRMKINGTGKCKKDPVVTNKSAVYVYSDNKCNNNKFLCSYDFTQEFSTSEDTDFDCDVKIDGSCSISNK